MQAVILWTLGTSWPHSRMASPVHICCASGEKARLGRCRKRRRRGDDGEENCNSGCAVESHRCVPQGCARCRARLTGGAARGLPCRTRHPSRGSHPVWLLDFCRCSNQKCCAAPRELCANVWKLQWLASTFPDCCVHATSSERQRRRAIGPVYARDGGYPVRRSCCDGRPSGITGRGCDGRPSRSARRGDDGPGRSVAARRPEPRDRRLPAERPGSPSALQNSVKMRKFPTAGTTTR